MWTPQKYSSGLPRSSKHFPLIMIFEQTFARNCDTTHICRLVSTLVSCMINTKMNNFLTLIKYFNNLYIWRRISICVSVCLFVTRFYTLQPISIEILRNHLIKCEFKGKLFREKYQSSLRKKHRDFSINQIAACCCRWKKCGTAYLTTQKTSSGDFRGSWI